MYNEMITINVDGREKEYNKNISLKEIADSLNLDVPVLLAKVDGKLCELTTRINKYCNVSWVGIDTECGIETYRRSVTMLFIKSLNDVAHEYNLLKDPAEGPGAIIQFSISKGYYCTLSNIVSIDQDLIDKIKGKMLEIVGKKIPIEKNSLPIKEAIKVFESQGMYGKGDLLRIRRASETNIYGLDGYYDYYYGYMVPDTSYLPAFDLFLYKDGLVLQMPVKGKNLDVPTFKPQEKLFSVLDETTKWGEIQGITNVKELNSNILKGESQKLVLIQEALQEKKIAEIASNIAERENVKFVLIAGPSSSGKTTFSHRLSVQLAANGLVPRPIAVDNYFVERDENPVDENGNYDFECLEAVDINLFNKQMKDLLDGKEVMMPTFDFINGKKVYLDPPTKLQEKEILVIEGIHCLNPELTKELDDANKFKIYISALTLLNLDDHNRIATTDARLLRRIIRDARTRGASASRTIKMWGSVRKGEEKNIFPYQEEADVMFNSSLIYELAVLKLMAEPILFNIEETDPAYIEANRLLKFLNYFVGIGNEMIPANSLVREFVGGGCFKV